MGLIDTFSSILPGGSDRGPSGRPRNQGQQLSERQRALMQQGALALQDQMDGEPQPERNPFKKKLEQKNEQLEQAQKTKEEILAEANQMLEDNADSYEEAISRLRSRYQSAQSKNEELVEQNQELSNALEECYVGDGHSSSSSGGTSSSDTPTSGGSPGGGAGGGMSPPTQPGRIQN